MKLGLHYWKYSTPEDPAKIASTLARTARIAEQAGVDRFTVMDHYFQMETPHSTAEEPMLEGYTTLGYVAAVTERMQLGLMVTGVMYRYRGCWRRSSARSTCCPAAVRSWGSAPPGTSGSSGRSGCRWCR